MPLDVDLWKRFIEKREPAIREKLILEHAPLVKYAVGRLNLGLPPSLESQDLVGYGMVGLMDAVDHFDLSFGVQFSTYAVARIRGQILDALRAMDLLPRSARRQARTITQAIAELQRTLKREPTDEELAAHLDLTLPQVHQAMQDAAFSILSLDAPTKTDNEGSMDGSLGDTLADDRALARLARLENAERKQRLVQTIRNLPERERLVISLYYYEELTMKEVAQVMGVSESRVCQIHAKAVVVLRAALLNDN
jgi:RNA polymerase sigma factor for flagellar operon FliA